MPIKEEERASGSLPTRGDPDSSSLRLFGTQPRRALAWRVWVKPSQPIVGSRVQKILRSKYIRLGAAPLAATADDASNVKVSDEDHYLSRSVLVKEPGEFAK